MPLGGPPWQPKSPWRTRFATTTSGVPPSTAMRPSGQHGLTNAEVYRGADDPNNILIVMDAPSREALLGFVSDPSLKTTMENGGVISEPTVVIGELLAAQPA